MDRKKVIDRKNLPVKFPLMQSILIYVVLDYYNAPGWLWGILTTLYSLIWILAIISFTREIDVNIFSQNNEAVKGRSKFQQRLDDYMDKQKQNA